MRRITCLVISLGLSASAIADTLYTNMKGYTLTSPAGENAVLQQFSTMLVENGKVQAIGGETLAQRFADTDSTVDMNGKTVLPGLTDAHGHIQSLGNSLLQVDLRDTESVSDAVQKVRSYAKEQQEIEWITGRGWNQEQWKKKVFPSAAKSSHSLSPYSNAGDHNELPSPTTTSHGRAATGCCKYSCRFCC